MVKPYFLKNEEWYERHPSGYGWILTDKATPEAVESYEKYMKRQIELEALGWDA